MTTSGERSALSVGVAPTISAPANPVAGADWSFAVAGASLLVAVTAQLLTSAVVANRLPRLRIADAGGHVIAWGVTSFAQAASLTNQYSTSNASVSPATSLVNTWALTAPLTVPAGATVATATLALDVADQWSNIVLTFAS